MEKMQEKEQNNRLKFDWHTHTVYSHGKGTIEDNVKVAIEKNLTSIAITDHGPVLSSASAITFFALSKNKSAICLSVS